MADPFLGEIRIFAGNFAPTGWALCQGQLLAIQTNVALFAILGTFYGGDGIRTFALPDLQGRFPVGMGNGAGLNPVVIGQEIGANSITLTTSNLPPHSHPLLASSATGTQASPSAGSLAQVNTGTAREPMIAEAYAPGAPSVPMTPGSVGNAGGGVPSITPPQLGLTFIIALQGIFPSRS